MTTYSINKHDEVVPYTSGRMSTDTLTYRPATDLELEQRDEIAELEEKIRTLESEIENMFEEPCDHYMLPSDD